MPACYDGRELMAQKALDGTAAKGPRSIGQTVISTGKNTYRKRKRGEQRTKEEKKQRKKERLIISFFKMIYNLQSVPLLNSSSASFDEW